MAVVELNKVLIVLMICYGLALLGGMLASVPMILHVYPQSECLLFSSPTSGNKLSYGHYATCNIVGWVYLFVNVGAIYLFALAWNETRKLKGHHPTAGYVPEKVPSYLLLWHCVVMGLAFLLTTIVTSGYVVACNNLHNSVSSQVISKLNTNPYDTRGEEIQTRYEDDYKFHRYTNRYGNAFGSEFYTIRITCRSILTDPEIHQRLHDDHYEKQSRYYGYWYGQDLYAYNSQYEAARTNALIESSLAGCWISMVFWLFGLIVILVQKRFIYKKQSEQDRISMHSTMFGDGTTNGSMHGSQFRKDGSLISGRGSSFQRGGSIRGSDRSMKSTRRDIDDQVLGSILRTPQMSRASTMPVHQASTSYGRSDVDELVLGQYIADNNQFNRQYEHEPRTPTFSRHYQAENDDLNYIRPEHLQFGGGGGFEPPPVHQNNGIHNGNGYGRDVQQHLGINNGFNNQRPVRQTSEAIYLQRDEMETEIF